MSERATVIIADHSEAFLMYIAILLQRLDFEVLPFNNGVNALKSAKAVHPNLVVLGKDPLGMSGLEVVDAMQGDDSLATVPILMVGDSPEDQTECLARGCTSFISKPIQLEKLNKALEFCRIHPNNQRKCLRAPFPQKVTLTFNHKTYECQAVTLSEGGIFIRRKLPLPQGCLLDITIPLETDKTITLEGEVIYTKQLSEAHFSTPPGMAIRFLVVNPQDAEALHNRITNLLVGDIIEEQEEPIIGS